MKLRKHIGLVLGGAALLTIPFPVMTGVWLGVPRWVWVSMAATVLLSVCVVLCIGLFWDDLK